MSMQSIRTNMIVLLQHPRAPLVGALLGATVLALLIMSWWRWQVASHQVFSQAANQQQQLQTIIAQLPPHVALVTTSDAMMATLSRNPMPAALQGKVMDVRVVNNQLKGQVNQANATALFAWLDQLSQSGLLVSTLALERSALGLVSGSIVWGTL